MVRPGGCKIMNQKFIMPLECKYSQLFFPKRRLQQKSYWSYVLRIFWRVIHHAHVSYLWFLMVIAIDKFILCGQALCKKENYLFFRQSLLTNGGRIWNFFAGHHNFRSNEIIRLHALLHCQSEPKLIFHQQYPALHESTFCNIFILFLYYGATPRVTIHRKIIFWSRSETKKNLTETERKSPGNVYQFKIIKTVKALRCIHGPRWNVI